MQNPDPDFVPARDATTDWEMAQARECAEHCEALILRLVFWLNWTDWPILGAFANRRAEQLARDIGAATAAIERWLEIKQRALLTAGQKPAR